MAYEQAAERGTFQHDEAGLQRSRLWLTTECDQRNETMAISPGFPASWRGFQMRNGSALRERGRVEREKRRAGRSFVGSPARLTTRNPICRGRSFQTRPLFHWPI